jgi:HSP20 family protein
MSATRARSLLPVSERWPAWFGRRGFPELWEVFGGDQEMKVEEFREDGSIVVRAELPGMDPDKDIEVTVKDGVLRIHAERTQKTEEKDKHSFRSEFRYGSFDRMLQLPPGASGADVKATYRDGILEVHVPVDDRKAEAQKVAISRK